MSGERQARVLNTQTRRERHTHLLAEVVADLNAVLDLGALGLLAVDVDGEVSIHQLHLVLVALGHTFEKKEWNPSSQRPKKNGFPQKSAPLYLY